MKPTGYNQILPFGTMAVGPAPTRPRSLLRMRQSPRMVAQPQTCANIAFDQKLYFYLFYSTFVYFILFFSALGRRWPPHRRSLASYKPDSAARDASQSTVPCENSSRRLRPAKTQSLPMSCAPSERIPENSALINISLAGLADRGRLTLYECLVSRRGYQRKTQLLSLFHPMSKNSLFTNVLVAYPAALGRLNLSQCFSATVRRGRS